MKEWLINKHAHMHSDMKITRSQHLEALRKEMPLEDEEFQQLVNIIDAVPVIRNPDDTSPTLLILIC